MVCGIIYTHDWRAKISKFGATWKVFMNSIPTRLLRPAAPESLISALKADYNEAHNMD